MKDRIIPKDSTIYFKLVGDESTIASATVDEDTEVFEDAILTIDGILYCTEPGLNIKKLNDKEYEVPVFLQDTMIVEGGVFYNTTKDIY